MHKRVSDVVGQLGWSARGDSVIESPEEETTKTRTDATVRVASDAKEVVRLLEPLATATFAARWAGRPGASDLVGVAVLLSHDSGEVLWLDSTQMRDEKVRVALTNIGMWTAHDAKPFMRWMEEQGSRLDSLDLDTAIAAYLLNPSLSSYEFEDVCRAELGLEVEDGNGAAGQLDFGDGPSVADSAAKEALIVAKLAQVFRASLDSSSVATLYRDVENPLVGVLARM
jgi:DNA polymerase-1